MAAPQAAVPSGTQTEAPGYRGPGVFVIGVVALFVTTMALSLITFALLPMVVGWEPVAVTSGSMEPRIRMGDVVVTSSYDGRPLAPGAVITFTQGGRSTTHRVAGVTDDGRYITKGDANLGEDSSAVDPASISGVGRMVVPFVGYPRAVWAQGRHAEAIAILGALVVLTLAARLAYPEPRR